MMRQMIILIIYDATIDNKQCFILNIFNILYGTLFLIIYDATNDDK